MKDKSLPARGIVLRASTLLISKSKILNIYHIDSDLTFTCSTSTTQKSAITNTYI